MLKGLYVTDVSSSIPATADNLINSGVLDVTEIDGLGRPSAELYTTELVGADASVYGTQSVKNRTITLSIQTRSNADRMELYRRFGYGNKRRLFLENDTGVYWIDGYVKGATYAAKPAKLTELEIPIFCPYPWFRSLLAHKVDVPFGTSFIAQQRGDICAGIGASVEINTAGNMTAFALSDSAGNAITYTSSGRYKLTGAKGYIQLVNTTPGAHAFFNAKAIQDISVTKSWVTVPPNSEIATITATFNTNETPNGRFIWYDTWSGI